MITNIEQLIKKITEGIKKEVDISVLGMSGGADSTLVACLCKLALGKENVYSVHMPMNKLDQGKFNANSVDIAEKLGFHILHAPITDVAFNINITVATAFKEDLSTVNRGNGRSRARMTVLYGIAHHLNDRLDGRVRVMGTGNLSEDFIGYDTKGGDALCDLFPIGELFKSEVYQLLEYFRDKGMISEDNIDRIPSAGLWDGQTDEDELGYSYNSMEESIKNYLALPEATLRVALDDSTTTEIDRFVINRHLNNKHKHEAPPVIEGLRKFCD